MRIKLYRFLVLLVPLSLIIPLTMLAARGDASPWSSVAPGIDYQAFQLPGPTVAYVARMDRSNPNVTIDTALAQGRLSSGTETVRDMIKRYDGALNFWGGGWGPRNRVAVAINGSYYYGTGEPLGGIIQSGWNAKRFSDMGGGSGFAWMLDRTAFIGGCVFNPPERQFLAGPGGFTRQIDAVNVQRQPNQVVMYTPQWDSTTLTGGDGVEIVIEMTAPAMIYPAPAMVLGYVREVRAGQGNTPIPFNAVVISAQGSAGDELAKRFKPGDPIGISQEIRNYAADCATPAAGDWTKAYASVGGAVVFLRDGAIPPRIDPEPPVYQPRTAVAVGPDYVYFIVVDGRDPSYSQGMTFTQLGEFARDTLGATAGIAEDGGGSSTMVINGKVVNRTASACYAVYLPLVTKGEASSGGGYPPPAAQPGSGAQATPNPNRCERKVADALMMVVVDPLQKSSRFAPGQAVAVQSAAALRLGPGDNYGVLAEIPAGQQGRIAAQLNGLDGVLARGAFWWEVSFDGVRGWLPEDALGLPPPVPAQSRDRGRGLER